MGQGKVSKGKEGKGRNIMEEWEREQREGKEYNRRIEKGKGLKGRVIVS